MTKGARVYETVSKQFKQAADLMVLDQDVRKILAVPMNEITVSFPAIMDDGRVEIFTANRVQHSNVLGPCKGGLRFHPAVDIAETAPLLNVKLVAEGAIGPTDIDGDHILQERGINVLPNVLCNAGGVIVSYFEWLQNKRSELWDLEEMDTKLNKKLMRAYERMRQKSEEFGTDWRTGAYIIALSRLEAVYRARGIFP